jgi:hypothetical protein
MPRQPSMGPSKGPTPPAMGLRRRSRLRPDAQTSTASTAWLLALLLVAGAPACKRKSVPEAPPPRPIPTLGPVTVQDLTPDQARPPGVTLDEAALTAEARAILTRAGVFKIAANDAGAPVVARVRIEVGLEDVVVADKGAARAVLRLRIDTRPSEVAERRFNEDLQAGAESQYQLVGGRPPERGPMYTKLVNRLLGDVLNDYLTRQKLYAGDPKTLKSAMQADGGELMIEAIRAAGERKLTSEIPRLLQLLEHPDESVRDAALGALVELRERKAVSVLAGQRSMRDKREMRKILDAIAVLGGPEAADYLGFVADGHEDQEIREMAKEAKKRLERRGEGK